MENRNRFFWVPLVMAACVAIGFFLGNKLTPPGDTITSDGQQDYAKMQEVIRILDQYYVDSLDGDVVFEEMIGEMLHRLDPHSNYIPASELAAINEQIEGQFGGVGVRFFIIRDTVCITNVIANSPSEKAGLKAGDKIIKIDGKTVAGKRMTNDDLMGRLKGHEGTQVTVTVKRGKELLTRNVVRGMIPLESISCAYMISGDIGFIRIDQFSVMTSAEFSAATARLKKQGMRKLIIDLRDNGGGILTGATEIADEFLKAGIPIVETRGVHAGTQTYRATHNGDLEGIKLAILVNENSASASEILAGAIQDNDRGTIIGRRTFGKGLVQQDYKLRDGSDLRLTIARYYTPTGRCIQKPYSEDYDEYYASHADRYESGELYAIDSTIFVDSLKKKTPGGKIVYGGGGIMPDVFVPYDSTGRSWYFTELRYSSSFNVFAFDYVQNKRSNWKSVDDFMRRFEVTDAVLKEFTNFAYKEMKIKKIDSDFQHSKELIKRILKAEIARQLWLEEGYFRVLNASDMEVRKALQQLR